MRRVLHLLSILSKTHNPRLIKKTKIRQTESEKHSTKCLASMLQGHEK
jgi:hypothetical protein